MNFLFPLFYLIIIVIFLLLILIVVIKEIFSLQNLQKQVNKLKITINLNQASLITYLNLGQIYLKKQLYSNTIEIYRKCILKWNKDDKIGLAYLQMIISFAYSKLALFDFAQISLEQSIFNVPTYIVALNNIIYIYERRYLQKKYIETLIYTNSLR